MVLCPSVLRKPDHLVGRSRFKGSVMVGNKLSPSPVAAPNAGCGPPEKRGQCGRPLNAPVEYADACFRIPLKWSCYGREKKSQEVLISL